jgi:hypothetical protein
VGGRGDGPALGGSDADADADGIGEEAGVADPRPITGGVVVGAAESLAGGVDEWLAVGPADPPDPEMAGQRMTIAKMAHRAIPTIRRGHVRARNIGLSTRMSREKPAPTGRSMSRTCSDYTVTRRPTPIADPGM